MRIDPYLDRTAQPVPLTHTPREGWVIYDMHIGYRQTTLRGWFRRSVDGATIEMLMRNGEQWFTVCEIDQFVEFRAVPR